MGVSDFDGDFLTVDGDRTMIFQAGCDVLPGRRRFRSKDNAIFRTGREVYAGPTSLPVGKQ